MAYDIRKRFVRDARDLQFHLCGYDQCLQVNFDLQIRFNPPLLLKTSKVFPDLLDQPSGLFCWKTQGNHFSTQHRIGFLAYTFDPLEIIPNPFNITLFPRKCQGYTNLDNP